MVPELQPQPQPQPLSLLFEQPQPLPQPQNRMSRIMIIQKQLLFPLLQNIVLTFLRTKKFRDRCPVRRTK